MTHTRPHNGEAWQLGFQGGSFSGEHRREESGVGSEWPDRLVTQSPQGLPPCCHSCLE